MTHTTAFFPHEISSELSLVRLEHVCLRFGDIPVLRDVNLRIERGRHLALLGPNGAGKSSLLRLLQGDLRPSSLPAHEMPGAATGTALPVSGPGKIYWAFEGKEESSALAARQYARLLSSEQQANYVRRGWNISGEEILLSGLDNAPMVYGEVSAALYAAAAELAEAAGASHLLAVEAPAMSQGQLRLMLILRALMGRPQLLLLDEPFDGLDRDARNAVSRCLELAAQKGATLLVTAHRKRDIPAFISRALLLENGALSDCDPAIYPLRPAMEKEACAVAARLPNTGPATDALVRADNPFLRALDKKIRPLLLLRDVDVFIDRQTVLSGICWRVEPGDRWGISGPNGSGKSTLMRLVYGEEFVAWGGRLEWCGGLRLSQEELRTGVGFVSDRVQHRYEYDISAEEVVVSGMRGSIGLYEEPEEWELGVAQYWLDLLEVGRFAKKNLHSLSGGTARKVLLARALAGSPPVLLLDEPCTGLDSRSRSLFLNALELLAGQGVTLIYASHHEEDRAAFFDKELRLEQGRIVSASGPI